MSAKGSRTPSVLLNLWSAMFVGWVYCWRPSSHTDTGPSRCFTSHRTMVVPQLHLSDVNFQWVKIREVVTDLQIQTLWNIAVMKAVLLFQMLLRHPLLEPLLCSQAVNLLLQLSIYCSVYKLWCLWFVLSCSIVMVWTGVRSWTLREEPSWPPSWRITATNWRAGPAAPCWLDPSTWNWGEERDSDSVCKRREG